MRLFNTKSEAKNAAFQLMTEFSEITGFNVEQILEGEEWSINVITDTKDYDFAGIADVANGIHPNTRNDLRLF